MLCGGEGTIGSSAMWGGGGGTIGISAMWRGGYYS